MDVFKDQYVFQLDKNQNIICASKAFINLFSVSPLKTSLSKVIPKLSSTVKIQSIEYNTTSIKANNNTVYHFLIPTEIQDPQEIFLAKMSHELKTLLNGIIGMAELLNDTILTSKQTDYMSTINQCSAQLLSIINDILDFTKMKSGKLKLKPEPFNVRECIEEALDIVALKATRKGLQLYQEPPKINTISFIIADKARLRQILINLLENAIKYTTKGEVIISYAEDQTKGKDQTSENGILFSVKDTGCGIPDDKQKIIFNVFNEDITTASGTGLGLAIVSKLVEVMGGTISVSSKVDKGSTFTFKIKADLSYSDDGKNNSPTTSISHKSSLIHEDRSLVDKTVLIVDDKPINRTIIAQQVIKWYMIPTICGSAMEAMTFIENNYNFDLAIIDVQMPDMNGLELAKQIKSFYPNLPIIAVSSLLDDPMKEAPFLTDAISKPVSSHKLYTIIMKTLKPDYETKYTKELALQPKKKTKILLVEDINFNQDVIIGFLKKLGYNDITSAFSGPEAINFLHSQTFNVIFMDISMQPMDGFQTTKEVMKLLPNKHTRPLIIAMTAHTNDTIKDKCFKSGMNAFIPKPIEISKLKTLLELIDKKLKIT